MKVLLIGHTCSPRFGSEFSFTWNWAWHLSREHQVWALVQPEERRAIEAYLAEHPAENLHFVWTEVPRWCDPWDPSRKRWPKVHYMMWQHAALRLALRLHHRIGFDVAHHVSWGTVSEPPLIARLPVPFVWGPIGGGQVTPPGFRKYLGPAWKKEFARTARVRLAAHRPALREAVRRSAMVLATNKETVKILKLAGACEIPLFLDSGLSSKVLENGSLPVRHIQQRTLLWVGKMEPRKCLPLALECLTYLSDLPLRLLVAGEGPLRREWETMATRMGLSKQVEFLGFVPFERMPSLYRSADIFLFTSLRDSFGSQVLEAMGSALPIVTLDHQGVGTFVPPEAGIKVPVTNSGETAWALAQGIRLLCNSPQIREQMGKAGWKFARTQTWERRARRMTDLYESAVRRNRKVASRSAFEQARSHVYRPS